MRRPSYGKYPKLSVWMKENNTNAKELSKEIGISYHSLWNILNGKINRPHPYTREAFQRVTGMTIEEAMEDMKDG